MIKGALLIPDEELASRIGELPKNKRIITHRRPVRALRWPTTAEAGGLQRGLRRSVVDIKKNGQFEVTPN